MEDVDSTDGAGFLIKDTGEAGERLIFEWVGAEGTGASMFEVSTEALQSARRMLRYGQGKIRTFDGKEPERTLHDQVPPFLLNRDTLLLLRSGAPFTVVGEFIDDHAHPMRLSGTTEVPVKIGKKTRQVPVMLARGKDISLWVVNDEHWPLLVRREEGDCAWRLNEILPEGEPEAAQR